MANNELSGIAVTVALAKYLSEQKNLFYTYRILFVPETIGSISYLSENLTEMKNNTTAGFVITCVGDDLNYSFLPSRLGNTYADKVGRFTLDNYTKVYKEYSFLERGSDERQYCSPGFNLDVGVLTRSVYGEFPEYHTSADNLNFVSEVALRGSLEMFLTVILSYEANCRFVRIEPHCEPQLGKFNLYREVGGGGKDSLDDIVQQRMWILNYADGETDLLKVAQLSSFDILSLRKTADDLVQANLIREVLYE